MGILKDAHLTGYRFNWLGSIFYIGYIVAEYPANLALQYLPIAKFLSSQIILWGAVATVTVGHHPQCKTGNPLTTSGVGSL